MQIECALEPTYLWRWIETKIKTEFVVYSSNNNKITHSAPPSTATLSKLSHLGHIHVLYTLYLPSKIWTTMAYHAGLLLTRYCQKRDHLPSGLMYFVKICIPCCLLPVTIKERHIIGLTLVCVSIHLECWLNKSRVEIVTWAVVGVAFQQQFSYNCVSKFWQCESNRCRFNWHSMSIGCMRIQFTFKQNEL